MWLVDSSSCDTRRAVGTTLGFATTTAGGAHVVGLTAFQHARVNVSGFTQASPVSRVTIL